MYANYLGSVYGTRPNVINLGVDGETTSSFTTGMGRVPPAARRHRRRSRGAEHALHGPQSADPGLPTELDHRLRGGGLVT